MTFATLSSNLPVTNPKEMKKPLKHRSLSFKKSSSKWCISTKSMNIWRIQKNSRKEILLLENVKVPNNPQKVWKNKAFLKRKVKNIVFALKTERKRCLTKKINTKEWKNSQLSSKKLTYKGFWSWNNLSILRWIL